jgi:thiol-disulfide isomerase/thioredoxin
MYTVGRAPATVLLLGILAVLGANWALWRSNSELRDERDRVLAQRDRAMSVQVGLHVPALTGYNIDGQRVVVDYASETRRTVLFVVSPDCPACDESWPYWVELLSELDARRVRVVTVNISSQLTREQKREYARAHDFGKSIFVSAPDAESRMAYRLVLTPQLLVVDQRGVVKWVRSGGRALEDRLERRKIVGVARGADTPQS